MLYSVWNSNCVLSSTSKTGHRVALAYTAYRPHKDLCVLTESYFDILKFIFREIKYYVYCFGTDGSTFENAMSNSAGLPPADSSLLNKTAHKRKKLQLGLTSYRPANKIVRARLKLGNPNWSTLFIPSILFPRTFYRKSFTPKDAAKTSLMYVLPYKRES
jgi:hypothetical protein